MKKRNTRQINSWKSNKNVPENDGNERAMMSAAKPVYWIAVTLYDYVIFVLCKYRDRSLHSTECGSPLLATGHHCEKSKARITTTSTTSSFYSSWAVAVAAAAAAFEWKGWDAIGRQDF